MMQYQKNLPDNKPDREPDGHLSEMKDPEMHEMIHDEKNISAVTRLQNDSKKLIVLTSPEVTVIILMSRSGIG